MIKNITKYGLPSHSITSLLVGVSLYLFVTALAQGQDMDASARFRLAQSFEQAGQWEKALTIYEELYKGDPQNYLLFDGLRRSYTQLKEYDKAIRLVHDRLRLQPADVNLLTILGGLYYKSGEEHKADSMWQKVVQSDPNNVNLYRLVTSQLIEHRLYDQAIRTYLAARITTGNRELFADELAALYGALLQYEAATREYVTIIRSRPQQLQYVQSRMASFTQRDEGRKAALIVAQEAVQQWPREIALHSLFAWLWMEENNFESALAEYRVIDRLSNSNGVEIFNFARLAFRGRAYTTAARAYREVIERHPSEIMLPQARLGFARCIEELTRESDTAGTGLTMETVPPNQTSRVAERAISESYPTYQGALALFEGIINDYPNTLYAAESLFRVGLIKFHRFFDLGGALAAFTHARAVVAGGNLRFEATAKMAEIFLADNNLRASRTEWNSLQQSAPATMRDQATFHLAELEYFESAFDSALVTLQHLTRNLTADLANDALQLQYFIQENKTTAPAALTEFAAADLLMRQRKYAEALARFRDLAKRSAGLLLEDDVLMKIGELHLLLKQIPDALASFQRIVTELPNSILRDKAQMRTAEEYEKRLRDKAKAIEAYEQILIKFPTSLYVEEARKRIRLLRGDAI